MIRKMLPILVISSLVAHLCLRFLLVDSFVLHSEYQQIHVTSQVPQTNVLSAPAAGDLQSFPISFNPANDPNELLMLQGSIHH